MAGINNLDPDDVSDADDVPNAAAVPRGGYYAMVLSSQLAKGIIKVNRLEQDRQALATLDHKRELLNGKVEAIANDPDVLGFQELFEQLVVEPDLYVSHLQVKDDVAVCRYGYPGRVYYTDSKTKKALHDKGIEAEPIPPQNQLGKNLSGSASLFSGDSTAVLGVFGGAAHQFPVTHSWLVFTKFSEVTKMSWLVFTVCGVVMFVNVFELS